MVGGSTNQPSSRTRGLWIGVVAGTLLLMAAQTASAQVMYGVSGGAAYQKISGLSSSTDYAWGGIGGLWASWSPVSRSIGRFEANYVRKGSASIRLDYVEIPILVGGSSGLGDGGLRGALYTGLAMGINVSCSTSNILVDCDRARTFDWGWPIGGMIGKWGFDQRLVALDVRYSLGFSNIFENRSAENRGWQFKLMIGVGTPRV